MRPTLSAAILALGVAASLSAPAVAQGVRNGSLVVENGQAVNLESGRVGYFVQTLTLGDGSRIIVPPATRTFVLDANRVNIGNGVAISAKGQDGLSASEPERHGPTIVLIFRTLERVQGLYVTSKGGDGIPGEAGRPGSKGKAADCSLLKEGGNGGNGGNGGRGGDAGHGGWIFLVLPEDASGYGISLNTAPGEPGRGGDGGAAGRGGRGKTCWKVPSLKVGSGRDGKPGSPGSDGKPGRLGQFRTLTFNDSKQGAGLEDRLRSIIVILRKGGYAGDAEALKAVLEHQGLNP